MSGPGLYFNVRKLDLETDGCINGGLSPTHGHISTRKLVIFASNFGVAGSQTGLASTTTWNHCVLHALLYSKRPWFIG